MTREELNDPRWRMRNLYYITDKSGTKVLFVPNVMQEDFLDNLDYWTLCLKARQQGVTTLIMIIALDMCLFVPNTHAAIIAQDQKSARDLFNDKMKFAYDNLDPNIRKCVQAVGDSKSELQFANGSTIRVSTTTRASTLQILHVSEFGKLCARYPAKAKEIITGALPSVGKDGFCFIESTAEGKEGPYYDLVKAAQEMIAKKRKRGPRDFKLLFYAWHDNPDYQQDHVEDIDQDQAKYFDDTEVIINKKFTLQQKYWYVATRKTLRNDHALMKQEYPSTVDESFEQSQEGCWFADQMPSVRAQGRVTRVPYQRGYPVHTCWDIGKSDGTAIWCFQKIGIAFHFINFIEDWNKEYDHYVAELQSNNYVLGTHYLPHDGKHNRQAKSAEESKTPKSILEELGLSNIVIVPQISRKILAINAARTILPTCYFDQDRTPKGVAHLEAYHKIWDTSKGCWSSEAAHDVHSEAADAFMQFATGYKDQTSLDINDLLKRRDSVNSTNPFNN